MSMYYDDDDCFAGDGDIEQAALEEAGARMYRASRRSKALRAAGDLAGAARECPHGGGYPLNSLAAEHNSDPRKGEKGFRCYDCGSVLSASPFEGDADVLHACDWTRPSGEETGHIRAALA